MALLVRRLLSVPPSNQGHCMSLRLSDCCWSALTLLVLAKQQEAGSLADIPLNQQ